MRRYHKWITIGIAIVTVCAAIVYYHFPEVVYAIVYLLTTSGDRLPEGTIWDF